MLVIKNAHVIDPGNRIDADLDLVVQNGMILDLGEGIASHYCSVSPDALPPASMRMAGGKDGDAADHGAGMPQVIDASGLVAAPGLVDIHVHFRDPGQTYKEDIRSGAAAAARGGFTTVVCMANTRPPVDNVETLEYVLREGQKTGIHVHSAAAVTVGLQGRILTDMETLKAHGAAGFTDDGIPIMDGALVKRAMEMAARLDVPLSFHEEAAGFIRENGINHGAVSDRLGIYGSPAVAEDTMVARDCMIALHTGAAVDIQHISSANSVHMVRLAKKLGAKVAAEATPHHFTLDETAVLEHGALAKMNPPLRSASDREEIWRGLRDGTIDIIATDHAPHSEKEKSRPLTEAPSGIIGLETSLALGITTLVRGGILTMPELIEKMSVNPAKLYRFEAAGSLTKGKPADIVIFDPQEEWTVGEFASRSKNSPFIGRSLYGKVKYTICEGEIVYEDRRSSDGWDVPCSN